MRARATRPIEGTSEEARLRLRLQEAEDALQAIRTGKVDAVVVSGPQGEQLFALKGAEHPYRVFVETMNEGAVTLLADGSIAYSNNRFAEIVREPLEEIIGARLEKFVAPAYRSRLKLWLAQALGGRCQEELLLQLGRDEAVWIQLSLGPVELEGATGICVVAADVSKLKALESKLREQNLELEVQNRQARAATRSKSEFLSNMSHELRSPLNGILGFSQMLYDGKLGPLAERPREFIGRINTSAVHLLHLIEDVLDLSKVEAGRLELQLERVSVSEVLREVIGTLEVLAFKQKIQIQTEVEAGAEEVYTDPVRLRQVLHNYLSNALKFTNEGGRIIVRVKVDGATQFRLEVSDTGIGIPEKDLGRLFVAFQQLDASTAKRHQGTGLGLALTKRVVEALGGRVGVESTLGKGSTFFAVLPRKPLPKPAGGTTVKVLVIEGDGMARAQATGILEEAGCNVESACTFAEALEKCQSTCFDAILLALLLPDGSGWEVLRRIRALRPSQRTPVIVLSLRDKGEVTVEGPIQAFLIKPIGSNELLEVLKSAGVLPRFSEEMIKRGARAVEEQFGDLSGRPA